jgi:hypothetical protein
MKKSFIIFLLILAAVGILLAVVPPLLPLTSLQLKVERQLQHSLGQPVHMGVLRFQVFPLPAFTAEKLVVDELTTGGRQPVLTSDSVEAGLNVPALCRGRFAVDKLVLRGPRLSGRLKDGHFLPAGLSRLAGSVGTQPPAVPTLEIPGSVMNSAGSQLPYVLPGFRFTIKVIDGNCQLENVPGLAEDLHLQSVDARYTYNPSHSGSVFHGEGTCLGGRFGADFYWHLPKAEPESKLGSLQVDGKLQVVGLLLKKLRLYLPASADFLNIPYGSGNLELEINGHTDKGFTLACQAIINDLMIEHPLGSAAAGKQRLVQNLSADLVATGYLAVKDDYVNLKSARLNLPGGATVFSKGLIKYGDRLVLDLLNDVSVPKLEALIERLPALSGIVGAPSGDCSGKINIIGNLAANPVLRLNLSSKHLSLLKPETETAAGVENSSGENSGGNGLNCSSMKLLERLLSWSVDSDWLTEVHCKVDRLDLCPVSFSELELSGKKMMNQLVVEKLAGKTDGGNVRVSLVVDDLLHDPLWNGSLVVKKVNLEKSLPDWPLTGELDGSLVLGGAAPTDDDVSSAWLDSIRGSGTLTVQKGAFRSHWLTNSFFGFSRLIGLQPADFLAPFSRLHIPVKISAKTCRMTKVKLSSPWYFFQGDGGLDFAGNLSLRGILSYADPAGPFTPGRPFPFRRRLEARGSLDRLIWE